MTASRPSSLFPVYGFTWNFYSKWVNTSLEGDPVKPSMIRTWNDYLRPLRVSVVKFNVQVSKYRQKPLTDVDQTRNRSLVAWLINACHFAEACDFELFPVLMGAGHYSPGKEREFPLRMAAFLHEFLSTLQEKGWLGLYRRIRSFIVESEMSHPSRHMLWPRDRALQFIDNACARLKEIEAFIGVQYPVPLTVSYPFDWLFAANIVHRPLASIKTLLTRKLYDCTDDTFFRSIATNPLVDIIGVDYFPSTWARYAVETLPQLVGMICDRYGLGTPWGKRVVVAETGYTQPFVPYRRDANQLEYYRRALELMVEFYEKQGHQQGFLGLMWYCLSDTKLAPNTMPFPGEFRYGVLATIPSNSYPSYPARPKAVWFFLKQVAQSDVVEQATDENRNNLASLETDASVRSHPA